MRLSFLAVALAGCVAQHPPPNDCGGHAGLDVAVDLSSSACSHLSQPIDFGLQLTIGSATIDKAAATEMFDLATHQVDYVFPWPAGIGDGSTGQADWFGSGDGAINGHATGTFIVERAACVTVDLHATCSVGVDAGP